MAVTATAVVMKTILSVRADAAAAAVRYVRAGAAATGANRLIRADGTANRILRIAGTTRRRRTSALRWDAAIPVTVAVRGTGVTAVTASAATYVIIAGSTRCAVAAIVAETECIRKRRRFRRLFFRKSLPQKRIRDKHRRRERLRKETA